MQNAHFSRSSGQAARSVPSPFLDIRPAPDIAAVEDPVDDFIPDPMLLERRKRLRWLVAVVLAAALALLSAAVVLNTQHRSEVEVRMDTFQPATPAGLVTSVSPFLDRDSPGNDNEAFGVRSARSPRDVPRPVGIRRHHHLR
jgi:hypothetical protein